jgi:hypothetical protein
MLPQYTIQVIKRFKRISGKSIRKNNDPGGSRTRDLRIKSPLLYQLSYRVCNPIKLINRKVCLEGDSANRPILTELARPVSRLEAPLQLHLPLSLVYAATRTDAKSADARESPKLRHNRQRFLASTRRWYRRAHCERPHIAERHHRGKSTTSRFPAYRGMIHART